MSQKPNFILDLDQTIISAESIEEFDEERFAKKRKKFREVQMKGYYNIFERPNLQPFLDFLFENFNVSVWTAASKDYALFIIEKILINGKKERILDYIFFSYHCDASEKHKEGTKDLTMLWDIYKLEGYEKNNTVILDDYDEVYETQNGNCIIAIPFEFVKERSENDRFLLDLKRKLKGVLRSAKYKNNFSISTFKINKEMKTIPN